MNKFWLSLFIGWPILAIVWCVISPSYGWWFPGPSMSRLGEQIDNLFYMINVIVTVVFIGTNVALGYVLIRGVRNKEVDGKAWFSHGSHSLEVLWSIAPAGILMFISLYQMDVWMRFRVKSHFPDERVIVAEVTARQFEWRIRYPSPDRSFKNDSEIQAWLAGPQDDDLYTVNDIHFPAIKPVQIYLRTMDVQHSFFVPELRLKQDAVPGQVIPIWFQAHTAGEYDLTCAELCGWGHFKMRGRIVAETETEYRDYLLALQAEQDYDGVTEPEKTGAMVVEYRPDSE